MVHAVGFVFLFVSVFWMSVYIATAGNYQKDDSYLITFSMVAMVIGFIMVQL